MIIDPASMWNKSMQRFTSNMPYLLYVAILQFGLYCCLTVIYGGFVYGGRFLSLPRFWILLLPGLLLIFLCVLVEAGISLRAKGLRYSATVGEFEEAKKRREVDRPSAR